MRPRRSLRATLLPLLSVPTKSGAVLPMRGPSTAIARGAAPANQQAARRAAQIRIDATLMDLWKLVMTKPPERLQYSTNLAGARRIRVLREGVHEKPLA